MNAFKDLNYQQSSFDQVPLGDEEVHMGWDWRRNALMLKKLMLNVYRSWLFTSLTKELNWDVY